MANQRGQRSTVDADGETQEAERFPLLRRALAIREGAFGTDHQVVAESLESLAFLYVVNGQFDKAEPLRERVLAIRQKCLPPDHPKVVRGLSELANFYRVKEPSKAEPAYRRSLTLLEKFLGPEHPDVAKCLQDLAEVCHSQNNLAEALPLYERALAIRETLDYVPGQSWYLGENLVRIARLYREQGKISEAEKVFQRTMTLNSPPGEQKALADLYHADELYEEALQTRKATRATATAIQNQMVQFIALRAAY